MKKTMKLFMAAGLVVFSANSLAVSLFSVGGYDTLLGSGTLTKSGSATEEAWIESVLGFDIVYTQLPSSGASELESVTGGVAGDFAFDFDAGIDPAYFLVKVGNGGGTGTVDSHFLFDNEASLLWVFINIVDFGSNVKLTNFGVISHVGITGSDTTVPEPGVVGLLAIGLLGMVAARRRTNV